jgi:FixJ family two-component response regulator
VPARGIKELERLVFVVDDDQSVRMNLADLLAREDYAVEIFASAAEYLARAPHRGPVCLVLEVQLPGFDGLALQRRLTEEARMEQIVFITAHGDIRMGIEAMKRGAIDFLPKPFRDDELLAAVAQALERSAELVESRARLAKLTPREFEVFRWIIAGLVNKEIGAELGVTLRMIKATSRPPDAEDRRGLRGGVSETGVEGGRRARAARHGPQGAKYSSPLHEINNSPMLTSYSPKTPPGPYKKSASYFTLF